MSDRMLGNIGTASESKIVTAHEIINSNLFVGVFGLIGGNYDKYVNAVFCDNNKDLMCKVFSYFCNHYSIANQMLLDSVMRNDEVEQGYLVNEEITLDLYNRFIEEENVCEYRGNLPNYLIAFVSKESYEEYRHMLSRIFSDYNIVCIGEVDDTIEKIELPKPDKNFYKICIGIGVAVLITLFIVLL